MAGIFAAARPDLHRRLPAARAPTAVYDEILERVAERGPGHHARRPAGPDDPDGPARQPAAAGQGHDQIEGAERAGARLVPGGAAELAGEPGLFVTPTVSPTSATRCTSPGTRSSARCCRHPFDDDAEAVPIANDTRFGLAAGVWTNDLSRAHPGRAARRGMVWVNTYRAAAAQAPFGGTGDTATAANAARTPSTTTRARRTRWSTCPAGPRTPSPCAPERLLHADVCNRIPCRSVDRTEVSPDLGEEAA